MKILIIMGLGILVGLYCFPAEYKKYNEKFQLLCTVLLIFIMGVSLGKRSGFFKDLASLGAASFVLAVIPILCSIFLVYILTNKFIKK